MPNLRAGFVITASLPASTVLFTSELLTEGVAPIPLDGSTMVEGTACPTTVSSPDDTIRGILAVELEKQNTNHQIEGRSTRFQKHPATYLSTVVWEEPRCFIATVRLLLGCTDWVSVLGVGLGSLSLLSLASSSSAQPSLDISTIYMKPHMSILRFD